MSERPFPVLLSYNELPNCPRSVPWSLLAPHEEQALRNHDQTLKRLAERGGLGVAEMVCVIDGKDLRDVMKYKSEEAALPRLLELIAAHATHAPPTPSGLDDLARIRAAGWMVAVHNDYKQNGELFTFWLFTHPDGRWLKGEGRTDAEALARVVEQLPW
jgi:hypothetical protein